MIDFDTFTKIAYLQNYHQVKSQIRHTRELSVVHLNRRLDAMKVSPKASMTKAPIKRLKG